MPVNLCLALFHKIEKDIFGDIVDIFYFGLLLLRMRQRKVASKFEKLVNGEM